MKKLLEEMEKNEELKSKVEKLDQDPKSAPKDYIELAAEYGIELKEEDFKPANGQGELNDGELDAVAGGTGCGCVIGGGGEESKYDKLCVCVGGGSGDFSEYAFERGNRCICVVAGGGVEGTTNCTIWGN